MMVNPTTKKNKTEGKKSKVSNRTKRKSKSIKSQKTTKKQIESNKKLKTQVEKQLQELKKLKTKLERSQQKLMKKLKSELKNVDWEKVKEPAMYVGIGLLSGLLLGSLGKRKK